MDFKFTETEYNIPSYLEEMYFECKDDQNTLLNLERIGSIRRAGSTRLMYVESGVQLSIEYNNATTLRDDYIRLKECIFRK